MKTATRPALRVSPRLRDAAEQALRHGETLSRLYHVLLKHDLAIAQRALEVIKDALQLLEQFPFSCRKASDGQHGPRLRELILPCGAAGYVPLFEIEDAHTVTILAVRHQRENDYY